MDYTIERISEKNCTDLKPLYAAVFKKNVSAKSIQKKYDTAYLGKSYFGHIAYFEKQPVAYFGAIPSLMQCNGKLEMAVQSVDSMVLESHAGKGLFSKLAHLTFEKLIEEDIQFIWGFANQASEPRFIKSFGFSFKDRIVGYSITTSKIPIEKAIRKFSFLNKIYDAYTQRIFKKYKTNYPIAGSLSNIPDSITVVRSAEFYDYKSQNDNFTIAISGVYFWIKIKNGLMIGDIEIAENADFKKAFAQLKKLAMYCGISEIVIQTSPETAITKWFDTIKSEKFTSWSICYKNFSSQFPLDNLKVTLGDLDTF